LRLSFWDAGHAQCSDRQMILATAVTGQPHYSDLNRCRQRPNRRFIGTNVSPSQLSDLGNVGQDSSPAFSVDAQPWSDSRVSGVRDRRLY
jgi:hypothetical protein